MPRLKVHQVVILLAICGLYCLYTALYKCARATADNRRAENVHSVDSVIFLSDCNCTLHIRNGVCYLYDPSDVPNCEELITGEGSNSSFGQAEAWLPERLLTDEVMVKILESPLIYQHCFPLKSDRSAIGSEGSDFPIAIVFKVHRDLGQLIQFLQTVYRPQDVYCITYDLKSSADFQRGVHVIAERLPNVILPAKHERIFWGHFTELMASVHCLKALDALRHPWNYLIDQVMVDDLPLKSPDEIAATLRSLNGAATFGGVQNGMQVSPGETKSRHTVRILHESDFADDAAAPKDGVDGVRSWNSGAGGRYFRLTREPLPPPPHQIRLYKYIEAAVSRSFAHLVASDRRAVDFLEWLRYTFIPFEHFYASLYYSLHAPKEDPEKHGPSIFRYQVWTTDDWKRLCHGICSHWSCIFGVRDLPTVVRRHELFVHKLTLHVQPAAYHCLREHLHTRADTQKKY